MREVIFRKGQNLVDLALIIGVVGLVFIGMEAYIRRGVQSKVKDLTDYIVSKKQLSDGITRNSTLTVDSALTAKESIGGKRSFIGNETSTYTYSQEP